MIRLVAVFLLWLIVPAVSSFSQEPSPVGTLTGVIMLGAETPMPDGKLVVFRKGEGPPPYPSRYLRPPDESVDIGASGAFSAVLPAGNYYLTAIHKPGRELIGPPTEGDFVFPGPAAFQEGQTVYTVRTGEVTDIGTVQAVRFTRDDLPKPGEITAVKGRVVDGEGEPVAGAIVFAFDSPNVVGKPLFVSEKTDRQGRFELRVSGGGTYYVKMRTGLRGGHPTEGELIGSYGDRFPEAIHLERGQVLGGVEIRARRFVNSRKANGKNAPPLKQKPGPIAR